MLWKIGISVVSSSVLVYLVSSGRFVYLCGFKWTVDVSVMSGRRFLMYLCGVW